MKILSSLKSFAKGFGTIILAPAAIAAQSARAIATNPYNSQPTYRPSQAPIELKVARTSNPPKNSLRLPTPGELVSRETAHVWVDTLLQKIDSRLTQLRRDQSQVSMDALEDNTCLNTSEAFYLEILRRSVVVGRWKILDAIEKKDDNALRREVDKIQEIQAKIDGDLQKALKQCAPSTIAQIGNNSIFVLKQPQAKGNSTSLSASNTFQRPAWLNS